MASEAIFGPKLEITTNLCFRPGLVTEFWFTSCLDTWRQVSISGFKPPGNRVKEPLMQAGQLVLSSSKQRQPRMCGYTLKLMICSFSGLRSSLLCPDCYSTFVRAWICTDDTGFLPASKRSSMLSQSKHWSDGRRICWTCSTSLELPRKVSDYNTTSC